MSRLEELLRQGATSLRPRAGDAANARLEAELLLALVLDTDRAHLLALERVEPSEEARWRELLARRVAGEPLAYLTGRREFRDLELLVDRRVLIPRPETETVVEAFLERWDRAQVVDGPLVDRGTGSGAIALSVCDRRAVIATDCSEEALAVAALNVERQGAQRRVHLLLADSLSALRAGSIAAVLSNPPYVEDLSSLPEDVREHEPRIALVPIEPWKEAYRRLLAESWAVLKGGGWLITEVGSGQAAGVSELLGERGFQQLSCTPDLAGIPRVVCGRRPA